MTRAEGTTGSTLPSPGEARSPSAVPAPSRHRALIASCIVLITALAWAYLVHLNRHTTSPTEGDTVMAGMGMVMNQPWGAGDLLLTFVMWAVMMVGMMAVPALPVLLLFAGLHARRVDPGVIPAVPSFGLGYLIVWLAFSACATAAQWALHEGALLSATLATSSTSVAGVILIAAGAYQLTPLKTGCLARCRSPLGFLMSNWRDGSSGAFRMGLRHGIFCLGCCWALMAVLFVVGVMNLAWVGVLTLFILAEKIGPGGARLSRAGGAILMVLGGALVSGWA